MLHDCFEKRSHVCVVLVSAMGRIRRGDQLPRGKTVLRAGVNNWKIELLICCLQLNEKIENHIDDLMRLYVFSVYLVDDDDRLEFVFERLAQDKARLGLRSVMGVDD